MVKATLNIPLGKERYKMIRKTNKSSWNNSQNIEKFQNYISIREQTNRKRFSIDTLNNTVETIAQKIQKKYCLGKKKRIKNKPEYTKARRKKTSEKKKKQAK